MRKNGKSGGHAGPYFLVAVLLVVLVSCPDNSPNRTPSLGYLSDGCSELYQAHRYPGHRSVY